MLPFGEASRKQNKKMKTYITPETTETKVNSLFAICEPSPGRSNIIKDAPGIKGGGTSMAPRREKVF
jgi:hypothetical protein